MILYRIRRYLISNLIPYTIAASIASVGTGYIYSQQESYMESEAALIAAEIAGMERQSKYYLKLVDKVCMGGKLYGQEHPDFTQPDVRDGS